MDKKQPERPEKLESAPNDYHRDWSTVDSQELGMLRSLLVVVAAWSVDARASTTGVSGTSRVLRQLDDLMEYYEKRTGR